MSFTEVACPTCRGVGEIANPLPLTPNAKPTYRKCEVCKGSGHLLYVEVLMEKILTELKILNGKKR